MQTLTVLIMTPLKLEYEAVSRHLKDKQSVVKEGAAYETGRFQGKHCAYLVVVAEPGMKNTDMALATERAIRLFQPQLALLIGIAGGIKDLKIGDVAIAKSAFNYDAGKESDNGFLPRPSEYHFSEELLAYAKIVQRTDSWKNRTTDGAPHASVHIASVAAGDKVVAAVRNTTFERIEQFLSHCKFLEMEAAGFGLAVQRHRNIHALVIRGISDLCAGKGETDMVGNWQGVAAERAAGVGVEVLDLIQNLSFVQMDISVMTAQALAQKIYEMLIPILLSNAPLSKEQALIWKKVAPLCSKELEKLKKSPDNPDRQAGVRVALEDGLEEDGLLKREVEGMVHGSKAASENHIDREQRQVHISPKQALSIEDLSSDFKLSLQSRISKGRPEQALTELASYTQNHPGPLQTEVIGLSDRWQELAYKNRMGLLSHENATLERNRIVNALINLIRS